MHTPQKFGRTTRKQKIRLNGSNSTCRRNRLDESAWSFPDKAKWLIYVVIVSYLSINTDEQNFTCTLTFLFLENKSISIGDRQSLMAVVLLCDVFDNWKLNRPPAPLCATINHWSIKHAAICYSFCRLVWGTRGALKVPWGKCCTGDWTFVSSEPCQTASFPPWRESKRVFLCWFMFICYGFMTILWGWPFILSRSSWSHIRDYFTLKQWLLCCVWSLAVRSISWHVSTAVFVLVVSVWSKKWKTRAELLSLYFNHLPPIYCSWREICLTRGL